MFAICFLPSATCQSLFLEGQQACQQNKFEKALEIFLQIEPKNEVVWLQLGICYGHLGQEVQSLIAFKKALIYSFSPSCTKLIQENIQKIKDKLSLPENSFTMRSMIFIDRYARFIPLFWWQIILLFFWFLLALSGIWLVKKKYYGRIGMLMSICLLCAVIVMVRYKIITRVDAVVVRPSVIYLSANKNLTTENKLIPGQEIIILQKKDQWCKINSNNQVGWIPCEDITIV